MTVVFQTALKMKMLVYENCLDCSFSNVCQLCHQRGKPMKQGLLGKGDNNKGLGITGRDLFGKYGRGFSNLGMGIGFRVFHI